MADQYTVTSTQSLGQRLKNALSGLILGPILILGSSIFLWNNELRSVSIANGLTEGVKAVVTIPNSPIDSSSDNKLVHTTGKANTEEVLKDSVFGVQENAITLKRVVEMYQWKQKSETQSKDNYGGSKTDTTNYTYSKVWSDEKIDSSGFYDSTNHANPSDWPYTTLHLQSSDVRIGDIRLSSRFIDQIPASTPVSLSSLVLNLTGAVISGDTVYVGKDASIPEIGDIRIHFLVAKPQDVSVVGKLSVNILDVYQTKSRSSIALLDIGTVGPGEMFQRAQEENTLITWLFRGLGLLLIFIGFSLIFQLLVILGKVLPPVAVVLSWGVGLVSFLATLLIGGTIIAIAWLVARPLLSVMILLVIVGVVGFVVYKKRGSSPIGV